jgi:hypothetical protein
MNVEEKNAGLWWSIALGILSPVVDKVETFLTVINDIKRV